MAGCSIAMAWELRRWSDGINLGSSITELILEIGNLLNSPNNNTTTFALEIPNQSFFLEINVKPMKEEKEVMNPYVVKKL